MKILVCFDGSQESLRVIEEASKIAEGCKVHEISVIHVFEGKIPLPIGTFGYGYIPSEKDIEEFQKTYEMTKEQSNKNLLEAESIFQAKNIKVNSIFKEGSPAEMITEVAEKEGFDLIVIGRRGISKTKKLFLGSVSNSVLQQASTSVLIVK